MRRRMVRTIPLVGMIVSGLAFVACFAVWQAGWADTIGCDTDAYRGATLTSLKRNNLYPTSLAGCDWLKPCSLDDVVDAHKRAQDIRRFAESLNDVCAKAQYIEWAAYVDYEADRGEKEIRTHETKNKYDKLRSDRQDVDRRESEILKGLR